MYVAVCTYLQTCTVPGECWRYPHHLSPPAPHQAQPQQRREVRLHPQLLQAVKEGVKNIISS